jgi:ADP-heptose:LPS heptosyltransferase
LLDRALALDEGRAILSIVVERLGDLFEPRLCRVYDALFADAIRRVCPDLAPRLRKSAGSRLAPAKTDRVYVLSRVTLGADVAVTSVLLDAVKRRYPEADIVFVGPRKSYELFEADARVRHQSAPYARGGTLIDRLRASAGLWLNDGIVIDPDSRLTQLGLISICDEDRYLFFESRSYGQEGDDPLPALAARWAEEILGVDGARPYIAPLPVQAEAADITVSLGVGENPSKRLGDEFERELLRALAETGGSVLVDKGGSAEERERVERALADVMHNAAGGINGPDESASRAVRSRKPSSVRTHQGAFAPFAAQIARSRLYVGYDSAGQHVAAACGVPLLTVFAGFVSERMFERWRPSGIVIRGDHPDVLDAVRAAITCTFRR